jgi:hypothetical protein
MATRKGGGQISDRVIEQLRQSVLNGIPFHQPETIHQNLGYADLIYLSTGRFYSVTDFIKTRGHPKSLSTDDYEARETALELWAALREEMILNHIEHQPRSRPWAWWHLEDREPRRKDESESEYLKRLRLLLPGEKKEVNEKCQNKN